MTEPIQRWGLGSTSQMFSVYGADGEWVRYEDHLAAIAAAVQRVEELPWTSETWLAHAERAAIIAAIKGDQP